MSNSRLAEEIERLLSVIAERDKRIEELERQLKGTFRYGEPTPLEPMPYPDDWPHCGERMVGEC